jgi:hypothetical protein
MIKLKELLLEAANGTITSSDIYNFYFLFYYSQHEPNLFKTPYAQEMEHEVLTSIKNKYLIIFKELLVEQINKYISRKRIDVDFPVSHVSGKESVETLAMLMSKTYRSDMKRRNTVWDIAAETTVKLEKISNPKMLYLPINALNMVVHNTHTQILEKLIGGYELLQALNTCADVDPKYYAGRVSKDLRDILQTPSSNTHDPKGSVLASD